MSPTRFLLPVLVVTLLCAGCTSNEDAEPEVVRTPKVPIAEGTKYYVGGPFLARDSIGRMRVRRFTGEVLTPPSRGLVIALTENEDKTYRYVTYINGNKVAMTEGVVDDEGFLRFDYREAYKQGKLIQKQTYKYDLEAQEIELTTEDFAADDGSLVRSRTDVLPYVQDSDEDEERYVDDPDAEDQEFELVQPGGAS